MALCATFFSIFCLLIIKFVYIGCDEIKGSSRLIFSHVIYRHGDRTPIDPYPNDPWGDLKYWPTGWGQLTNIGKRQHYELGQWLRKRYINLVNQTYSKDEVYIRSTDVDRTLMSAMSNLAGFYPPQGKQIWNDDIKWQPIPVHTIPEKEDHILAAKKQCNAYEHALSKLKKSEEFQKLNKELSSLYKYLTLNTGREISSIEGVQNIYNALFIETLYNKTLPEWTAEVYPDKMQWVSARSFATYTYTRYLARLKTGPLLKEILERFQKKSTNSLKTNRSLYIYSGHDTTISNVLNTLKLFEQHNPPYRACIMIELHMIDDIPNVMIFYKNTTDEPKPMYIPKCGSQCPLDKMFILYNDVIPEDWHKECKLSVLSLTYEEAEFQPALVVILCSAISILLVLIALCFVTIYRRREYLDTKWYMRVET